jgi:lambda repressor-like predicted transcriptional regulator
MSEVMLSELSYLLHLLMDYKLSKPVQDDIRTRIKEIEAKPAVPVMMGRSLNVPANMAGQSPSTIANMLKDPAPQSAALPQEAIVASPAAAQAMQARAHAIQAAMSTKPEPGRTSPRKF